MANPVLEKDNAQLEKLIQTGTMIMKREMEIREVYPQALHRPDLLRQREYHEAFAALESAWNPAWEAREMTLLPPRPVRPSRVPEPHKAAPAALQIDPRRARVPDRLPAHRAEGRI